MVEGNGDVYPCDFYVLDRFRLGNIRTDSLEDMATCDALRAFLDEPRRACSMRATCPFERICHKNCKRLNTCYYREDYCGYRGLPRVRGARHDRHRANAEVRLHAPVYFAML